MESSDLCFSEGIYTGHRLGDVDIPQLILLAARSIPPVATREYNEYIFVHVGNRRETKVIRIKYIQRYKMYVRLRRYNVHLESSFLPPPL